MKKIVCEKKNTQIKLYRKITLLIRFLWTFYKSFHYHSLGNDNRLAVTEWSRRIQNISGVEKNGLNIMRVNGLLLRIQAFQKSTVSLVNLSNGPLLHVWRKILPWQESLAKKIFLFLLLIVFWNAFTNHWICLKQPYQGFFTLINLNPFVMFLVPWVLSF